jgi:hypothetical protein
MSMYTELLRQALDDADERFGELTSGQLLARLLRCRSDLFEDASISPDLHGGLSAVATQLAYDAALVGFARQLGITSSAESFDQSQRERARLERALSSNGVSLDHLDRQAHST